MMRYGVIIAGMGLLAVALGACGNCPAAGPTQIVKVPIPVACDAKSKLKPAPDYPTPAEYGQAKTIDQVSKLATQEILLRREREKELLTALDSCANVPGTESNIPSTSLVDTQP